MSAWRTKLPVGIQLSISAGGKIQILTFGVWLSYVPILLHPKRPSDSIPPRSSISEGILGYREKERRQESQVPGAEILPPTELLAWNLPLSEQGQKRIWCLSGDGSQSFHLEILCSHVHLEGTICDAGQVPINWCTHALTSCDCSTSTRRENDHRGQPTTPVYCTGCFKDYEANVCETAHLKCAL